MTNTASDYTRVWEQNRWYMWCMWYANSHRCVLFQKLKLTFLCVVCLPFCVCVCVLSSSRRHQTCVSMGSSERRSCRTARGSVWLTPDTEATTSSQSSTEPSWSNRRHILLLPPSPPHSTSTDWAKLPHVSQHEVRMFLTVCVIVYICFFLTSFQTSLWSLKSF